MRRGFAVLLAGVLLLGSDLVVHDRLLYFRDVQRLFVPLRAQVAAAIHAGRLPLWNPHQWLGVPLWGDPQAAVLYPPNMLFTLLPLAAAWRVNTVLHLFMAAAFAAGFFRRVWRFGVPAAVLGGATYGLGSTLASCTSLPNMLAAAAWLPLALWACAAADRSERVRGWAILGVVLGVQMLAGSAEVCVLTWLACGLHLLFVPGAVRAPLRLRGVVVALLVGVGLAAAQILPAYELAVRSARPHVGFTEATGYSLHPLSWLGLLVPGIWGSHLDGTDWGGFLVLSPAGDGLPLFERVYAGFLPWLLAVVALRRAGWPRAFTLGFLGVCLGVALGRHTPGAALVYRILPLPLRYPEKAMLGVAFALACLAAGGLEAVRSQVRARSWAVPAALLFSIGTLLAGLSRFGFASLADAALWIARHANVNPLWTAPRAIDVPNLTIQGLTLAVGALLAAALLAARSLRGRAHVGLGWLVGVGMLDLIAAARPAVWTTPAALYERRSPLIDALQKAESGAGRILHEPGSEPPSALRYPVRTPVEREAWWLEDIVRTNTGAPAGVLYADGYGPANLYAIGSIPLAAWPWLGLGWVVRSADGRHLSDTVAPAIERRWPELGVELARVEGARPRAYWTDQVQSIPTADSALALIRSGHVDLRRITLLEPPRTTRFDLATYLGGGMPAAVSPPPIDAPATRIVPARVTEDRNNSLTIEVDAPARGFLVVNDSSYPGWRARVDGRDAPILLANAIVRAVPLEAGRHRIMLEYRPASVLAGVAISLVAIAVVLVLCRRLP